MTLWFVFALMTAGAAFAVLWPLGRSAALRTPDGSETTVYRDQLAEVGRDADAGLIGAPEAAAARVRDRAAAAGGGRCGKPSAAIVKSLVAARGGGRRACRDSAAGARSLSAAGSPRLPDFPLAERVRAADASQPLENLVAQVESLPGKDPADGRGWTVLAPVLIKLGRFDDAARAYRNAITYDGETAERRADLGTAIAGAANGIVTADAKKEFERAVTLDPRDLKARYFLAATAAEQDGRTADAAKIWQAMLADAPADAEWRGTRAGGAGAGGQGAPRLPDQAAVTAASGMNEADRSGIIHGMVDRLAERLKQDGNDVDGWLRLWLVPIWYSTSRKSRAPCATTPAVRSDRMKRVCASSMTGSRRSG